MIQVAANHEALSREAAQRILRALAAKPEFLWCAAGGATPTRTYQLLVEHHARDPYRFAALRLVKLDEWGGLTMDDPGSCETQLRAQLVVPLGLPPDRYFGFNSNAQDPEQECERVAKHLRVAGPMDLCLLGLGVNGHLGMNEPARELQLAAHVAHLTETSLRHSMLRDSPTRPTYGLTLGMGEIMASREILLLVSGANKREALARLMRRELTTEFPASVLWLHPNLTLLCDREAAAGLDLNA